MLYNTLIFKSVLDIFGLLLLLPVRGETPECPDTRVCKWRTVCPNTLRSSNNTATRERIHNRRSESLRNSVLKGEELKQTWSRTKTNLILRWGKAEEQRRKIWVRIWKEWAPVYRREKYRTFFGAEWTSGLGWDTFSKNVRTQRSKNELDTNSY